MVGRPHPDHLRNRFRYKWQGSALVQVVIEPPQSLTIKRGGKVEKRQFQKRDQFAAEIGYFADCILENRKLEPSGKGGMADAHIVEAIYKAIKAGSFADLSKGRIYVRRFGNFPTANRMKFAHSRHLQK